MSNYHVRLFYTIKKKANLPAGQGGAMNVRQAHHSEMPT